jgi:hypothetical protein
MDEKRRDDEQVSPHREAGSRETKRDDPPNRQNASSDERPGLTRRERQERWPLG